MIQRRTGMAMVLIAIGATGLLVLWGLPSTFYSVDRASKIAENYLMSLNDPDLALGEIMEFEQNFYVVYYEESTDIGAFEMLIDRTTGRIFPEYGPNMMWNTKYGLGERMMGGGSWGMMGGSTSTSEMELDENEALDSAQKFLDRVYPGTTVDDIHPFYGYYTLHAIKDGKIFGMLSVNGYDGAVWYHNWHGAYIQSLLTR